MTRSEKQGSLLFADANPMIVERQALLLRHRRHVTLNAVVLG
jgi:hypothetical protein